MTVRAIGIVLLSFVALTWAGGAQDWAKLGERAKQDQRSSERVLQPLDIAHLPWRSIGPANQGGRVASIALAPSDPKTIYVGYGTGGVWKSINNGTTFTPIFDNVTEISSIGAVAVADAPADWPGWEAIEAESEEEIDRAAAGKGRIVWVATGEGNGRNSSSWGRGVYRSTDSGATFKHVGLADSHDIPSMAVDPRNPDVCYIAAMGHLWGPNEMRGLYKTTDGGATWQPALQIDENTGCCDVILDPANPDTVYAAMYARRRTGWSFQSGGPEGGIYRSDDGGQNWKKLTEGLPAQTGRIGLDIYRKDPNIIYATVESNEGGIVVDEWQSRSRSGGVFRSNDRGETWERLSDLASRQFYFSRIRVDPEDSNRVYVLGFELYVSDDGGTTFRAGFSTVVHVDFHAMVIDPNDTDHLLIGTDGGLYVSWDRGATWDFHNHMAVGQFYNVAVDLSDPYRVGGGLQDNGTWIGPSETITKDDLEFMGRKGAITNGDWQFINNGDGFHVAFDPDDPNIVYAEWQGGNLSRIHLDTGVARQLKPAAREGEPKFRFNWNAPFFISPHDPSVVYFGGNHVFKLTERGDRWEMISPDLTRNEVDKNRSAGSEAETYNTIVSLAESPAEAGVIWAGTDDGLVHVTSDGGGTWKNVTPEGIADYYIAKIEPSHHDANRAFVAVDPHTSDVFKPILFVTDDRGASWRSITGDLPEDEVINVVRESQSNPDVLFIGTERACYVSIDRGKRWVKLNGEPDRGGLPPVAVDDLVIHPREHDLVAGTHGRSVWILDDVSAIEQLTPEIVASEFHAFEPMPAKPRYYLPYGGLWSDRMFIAQNPPMGAYFHYWVREYTGEPVSITITDSEDRPVHTLDGPNTPGLNRVVWDLQRKPQERIGNPDQLPEFVPPGEYKVTMTYGEEERKTTLTVLPAPGSAH